MLTAVDTVDVSHLPSATKNGTDQSAADDDALHRAVVNNSSQSDTVEPRVYNKDVVLNNVRSPMKARRGVPSWFAGKVSKAFAHHIFWPSPPKKATLSRAKKALFPACASTAQWRDLYLQTKAVKASKFYAKNLNQRKKVELHPPEVEQVAAIGTKRKRQKSAIKKAGALAIIFKLHMVTNYLCIVCSYKLIFECVVGDNRVQLTANICDTQSTATVVAQQENQAASVDDFQSTATEIAQQAGSMDSAQLVASDTAQQAHQTAETVNARSTVTEPRKNRNKRSRSIVEENSPRPKTKRRRTKTTIKTASSTEQCMFCGEIYEEPPTEDWIQCSMCLQWCHEACAHVTGPVYVCDNCM
jgi:hypothetical protein